MSPQPSNRFVGLDVLRGIASLAVVFSHIELDIPVLRFEGLSVTWLVTVMRVNLGAWGVGVFFVLSGLCIHLPFSRRRLVDPTLQLATKSYAVRRFLRIYPPHLVALALSALVRAGRRHDSAIATHIVPTSNAPALDPLLLSQRCK